MKKQYTFVLNFGYVESSGLSFRDNTFSAYDLHKKLTIEADDKSFITEAWSYIDG